MSAPDRVGKIKVATVCLEHGKDDPNPRVAYELKPITEFTRQGRVGRDVPDVGQRRSGSGHGSGGRWHLSDGLSFQQLAEKIRVRHLNGQVEMYFNPQQLTWPCGPSRWPTIGRPDVPTDPEPQSPGELADAEAQRDASSLQREALARTVTAELQ